MEGGEKRDYVLKFSHCFVMENRRSKMTRLCSRLILCIGHSSAALDSSSSGETFLRDSSHLMLSTLKPRSDGAFQPLLPWLPGSPKCVRLCNVPAFLSPQHISLSLLLTGLVSQHLTHTSLFSVTYPGTEEKKLIFMLNPLAHDSSLNIMYRIDLKPSITVAVLPSPTE